MGYYINQLPGNQPFRSDMSKAEELVTKAGGVPCGRNLDIGPFEMVPPDKALICVCVNPPGMYSVNGYEAALFVYSKREYDYVINTKRLGDQRLYKWLLLDWKLAEELSGFTK